MSRPRTKVELKSFVPPARTDQSASLNNLDRHGAEIIRSHPPFPYGWASCPLTQTGLLRIVSQPRYTHPATVIELLALLTHATSDPSHEFSPEDVVLAKEGTLQPHVPLTSSAITDIYLLAVAVRHAGSLVTLDTRISRSATIGSAPEHLQVLSTNAFCHSTPGSGFF